MASVRQKNGYLFIDYRVGGKREKEYLHIKDTRENRKEAEIRLKQIEYEIASGIMLEKKKRTEKINITITQGLKKYLAERKLKKSAIKAYTLAVKKFVKHAGDIKLRNVTSELVKETEEKIRNDQVTVLKNVKVGNEIIKKRVPLKRTVSENTIATYFNHLRILFNYFKDKKYVYENYFERRNIEIKEVITIPDEDMKYILGKLKEKNQTHYKVISFLFLTGLRKNEIIGLTFNDIDFKENIIKVNNFKGNRIDKLPLHDTLKQFLITEWEEHEGKLFNYSSGDSLKFFDRFLKREGFENYSFHSLRKTYITKLINSGMGIYDVMTLARHKDIRTTLKHYSRAELNRMGDAITDKTNFNTFLGPDMGPQNQKGLKLIKNERKTA